MVMVKLTVHVGDQVIHEDRTISVFVVPVLIKASRFQLAEGLLFQK